jgi:RNA polymerase sigma-70 factor (ECF subfamily)
MAESPTTQRSLLVRLRDSQDGQAWTQFVEVYAPLVYGFARKHGLQDADAADLTQEVLRAVAGAAGRLEYDPQRGSFRGWLFTIVRNKLRNFLSSPQHRWKGSGDSQIQALMEEQPAPEDDGTRRWDQEYEQRLFDWAAAQVRRGFEDKTWQAFWQTAVEGKHPKQVAEALAISVGAVYIAKSRVLARLRDQVQQLQVD